VRSMWLPVALLATAPRVVRVPHATLLASAASRPQPRVGSLDKELVARHPSTVSRRAAVLYVAAAAAVVPACARADDLATAYFSAGDPRFLQKAFDEIKYGGIVSCEVGSLGAVPSIRVTYKANKLSYKKLLGIFWRACDPTSSDQFGSAGPTILWTGDEVEKGFAEESRRRLQYATQYTSNTFGPMYKGRPILTEIRPVAGAWEPSPEVDQDWYINEPKAYEQARKKTGRTKWFEDAFKPVTVTACQKNDGEGAVCGFVYFPCSEENGCKAVTGGNF